jgi:hypothetical protein
MPSVRRAVFGLAIAALAVAAGLLAVRLLAGAGGKERGAAGRGRILDRSGFGLAFDDSAAVRRYPLQETTSVILGFVKGAGLEASLDSLLASHPRLLGQAARGRDVRLTIDADVQRMVFSELRRHVTTTRSARGAAVVVNARTGAALALADYPGCVPERFRLYPREAWETQTAGLEFAPGPSWAIAESLAGVSGDDIVLASARWLSLGKRTGIEVGHEMDGSLPDSTDPEAPAASAAMTSRVTLLQLVRAYSVLATGARPPDRWPFLVSPGRNAAGRRAGAVLKRDQLVRLRAGLSIGDSLFGAGGFCEQPGADSSRAVLCFAGASSAESRGYAVGVLLISPLPGHYTNASATELFSAIFRQLPATH